MSHSTAENRRWNKLLDEIAELTKRKLRRQIQFPDLSVGVSTRVAPVSNCIAIPGHWTAPRASYVGTKQFPVGHSHKQGMELLTPLMIRHDLAHMGGKKRNTKRKGRVKT